jgi:cysteinyl-tRNA synthetase
MEKIFLYNTLTRKKEEFRPIIDGEVLFYQCGPTVYWTQHIGNLRAAVLGDIIRRVFEYDGYNVKYVKNYTDVGHLTSDSDTGEDKMEKGVKRENLSPQEIAQKYIKIYEDDIKELNILPPTVAPLATENIPEMQAMIKILLEKGFAYSTPLAIYFDVSKFPNYTALSGQNLDKNMAGEGSGEVSDSEKKNPHDFALWFFRAGVHANALQYWPSKFSSPLVENGNGFPGWHIECSAMSKKYLGDTLDVHMGGIEHIPVHHTNEIAQSESANGVKYVNYWLHNEHLLVNNEKMAKSAGTGFTLAEVKAKGFSPLALRYYFLSANYRSKQNFTWEAMQAAQNGLDNLYNQICRNAISCVPAGEQDKKLNARYCVPTCSVINVDLKNKFLATINDDFNTPAALAILQEVLKSNLSAEDKLATILDFDKVFGLDFAEVKPTLSINVTSQATITGTARIKNDIPEEIIKIIIEREKAREEKKWVESDRLRAEIEVKGFFVEDTKDGMKISKK